MGQWRELPECRRTAAEEQQFAVFELTDWPLRPLHRMSRVDWQPRRVHVTWTRRRSNVTEPWGPWRVKVGVHGQKIKKDGTDAQWDYNEPFPDPRDDEWAPFVRHCEPTGWED